jgi:hypothetical protein
MAMAQQDDRQYVVLHDTQYYAGDCQHPQGWSLDIATYRDHESCADRPCIGTLAECESWEVEINDGPYYMGHGVASGHTRIGEIVDQDADYQGWLDSVDWDGCPSSDGADYDANTAWAEDQAYATDGVLPIAGPLSARGGNAKGYGSLILVDLSPATAVVNA